MNIWKTVIGLTDNLYLILRLCQISTKMTSAKLDQVEDVDIDTGRFKYILIKVHDSPEGGPEVTKHIVRG